MIVGREERTENATVSSTADGFTSRVSTMRYAGPSRVSTFTSPAGRVWSTRSDADGRIVEVQTPGQVPTVYQYTTAQMQGYEATHLSLVSRTKPGSLRRTSFTNYVGDFPQLVTSRISPVRSVALALNTNASGFTSEVGVAGAIPSVMTPDESWNSTSVTPPARPAHGLGYDARGLGVSYAQPGSSAVEDPTTCPAGAQCVTYDRDRQPAAVRLSGGTSLLYGYAGGASNDGMLRSVTVPSSGQTVLGYDGAGRMVSAGAPDGAALGWAYQASQPIRASWSGTHTVTDGTTTVWSGTLDGQVKTFYSAYGEVARTQVVNGYHARFDRDLDGLVTGVVNAAGGAAVPSFIIGRHALDGSVVSTSIGSVATSQGLDISASAPGYGDLTSLTASFAGTGLFSTSYVRDDLGRISELTETLEGTTRVVRYSYDDHGRLYQVRDGSDTIIESYVYDDNGNRTQVSNSAGSALVSCPDGRATNDVDQLCTQGANAYVYDGNGALQQKSGPEGDTHYSYDGAGRLTKVILPDNRVIHYVNDALGRRIGKVIDGQLVKGWLYADGLRPIAQLNAAGAIEATFVYATRANIPDLIVKQEAGTQVAYRVIADHLGTPRLIARSSDGAVVQRMTLDAFGQVLVDSNPGSQPFGFAGGLYDPDTELVRFGARDYDAETGRWTASDPILFRGGQSNLYAYVNNDPVNYRDPTGLYTEVVIWEPVGYVGSSFGHVSININGVTYSFAPGGLPVSRRRITLRGTRSVVQVGVSFWGFRKIRRWSSRTVSATARANTVAWATTARIQSSEGSATLARA